MKSMQPAKCCIAGCALSACIVAYTARGAEDTSRWQLAADGGIVWSVAAGDAHQDFIEMSGQQVGLVVRYGVNPQGLFSVNEELVWPLLRLHPNLTGSHLRVSFGEDVYPDEDDRFSAGFLPALSVRAGEEWVPLVGRTVDHVHHKGITQFDGTLSFKNGATLGFRREVFPSVEQPAAIDTTLVSNRSRNEITLSVDEFQQVRKTSAERGVYGS